MHDMTPLATLDPSFSARLTPAGQVLEAFADALVNVSDALDVVSGASSDGRLAPMRGRVQAVYDELNSMMKELAD